MIKNYAQLDSSNNVVNISIADESWDSTGWVEFTDENPAYIGGFFDPIDNAFIPPMPACNHDSLTLNAQKCWECSECEALFNEANPL